MPSAPVPFCSTLFQTPTCLNAPGGFPRRFPFSLSFDEGQPASETQVKKARGSGIKPRQALNLSTRKLGLHVAKLEEAEAGEDSVSTTK
ncbi:hypothetical protein N7490_005918 [Penicillium lividum]|nr:hypothetical protein N7490_005918 [Penicillium lividum]